MNEPNRKKYKIEKATWVAFCSPVTKKALFLKEFVNGGTAFTPQELIMNSTKAALLADLYMKNYTYTEPKSK